MIDTVDERLVFVNLAGFFFFSLLAACDSSEAFFQPDDLLIKHFALSLGIANGDAIRTCVIDFCSENHSAGYNLLSNIVHHK